MASKPNRGWEKPKVNSVGNNVGNSAAKSAATSATSATATAEAKTRNMNTKKFQFDDMSEQNKSLHRSAFLYILESMTDTEVEIDRKDGSRIAGVLHTCTPFKGKEFRVAVRATTLLRKADNDGPVDFKNGETVIMSWQNIVALQTANKLALKPNKAADDLRTDSTIATKSSMKHLQNRELQAATAWLEPSTNTSLGTSTKGWDQFETNQRLFNVKSTYDENLYTKKLDKSALSKEQLEHAERVAREIESSTTTNIHLLEERGHALEREIDEEDRYSGVIRETQSPRSNSNNSSIKPLRNSNSNGSLTGTAPVPENVWRRGLKPITSPTASVDAASPFNPSVREGEQIAKSQSETPPPGLRDNKSSGSLNGGTSPVPSETTASGKHDTSGQKKEVQPLAIAPGIGGFSPVETKKSKETVTEVTGKLATVAVGSSAASDNSNSSTSGKPPSGKAALNANASEWVPSFMAKVPPATTPEQTKTQLNHKSPSAAGMRSSDPSSPNSAMKMYSRSPGQLSPSTNHSPSPHMQPGFSPNTNPPVPYGYENMYGAGMMSPPYDTNGMPMQLMMQYNVPMYGTEFGGPGMMGMPDYMGMQMPNNMMQMANMPMLNYPGMMPGIQPVMMPALQQNMPGSMPGGMPGGMPPVMSPPMQPGMPGPQGMQGMVMQNHEYPPGSFYQANSFPSNGFGGPMQPNMPGPQFMNQPFRANNHDNRGYPQGDFNKQNRNNAGRGGGDRKFKNNNQTYNNNRASGNNRNDKGSFSSGRVSLDSAPDDNTGNSNGGNSKNSGGNSISNGEVNNS